MQGSDWRAYMWLCFVALAVHLPALSGWYRFDPIYLVSGVTDGTWHSNGLLHGFPWLDPNAGVTTQALGSLAARDWLHGVLPGWNPYSGIGLPLAAEGQTPAFFLPFVLLLALPHGLLALRIVLMMLAGCFTFTLLRHLRAGVLPALTGAMLFELNGTFAWFAHGPIMPVAFLPLMLLGLEQARTGKIPFTLAAGIAWSFLSGFPETAVLDLSLAATWGALRTIQAAQPAAYVGRCSVAAAAGLLIAAPAMWPFLEALPRAFVGKHLAGLGGSLWPGSLALALLPGILGNPLSVTDAPASIMGLWWRAGGYLPLGAGAVALTALRLRGPDVALRATLAAFVVLTAARAAGLPAAIALFGAVPLLRQAMVHTYIWPAWCMAAAILAGFALQDFRENRRLPVLVAGAAAACLAVMSIWLAAPAIGWMMRAPPPLYHPMEWVAAYVTLAILLLALLAGTATIFRERTAAFLLGGQSAALFGFWLLAGPHGRTPDDGAIRFLQTHLGLGRVVGFGPLVPNYGAMFGLAQVGYNALPIPSSWAVAAQNLQPGSDSIVLYEGTLPEAPRLRTAIAAYEALGAAYALTWPGENLNAAVPAASLVYHGTVMNIWSLPAPAPYMEAPGCALRPLGRSAADVTCPAATHFMRRELFDPGWHAQANGSDVSVQPAGLFQTIALPAGATRVTFAYAPPFIGWAWAGFAAGVLLLIGATLHDRRGGALNASAPIPLCGS